MKLDLDVICLQSEAYYKLIQEIIDITKELFNEPKEEEWIDREEAMLILKIGKSTLQKYRDLNLIVFSQPTRNKILYHRPSLLKFISDKICKY
jgi:hypothetical protein